MMNNKVVTFINNIEKYAIAVLFTALTGIMVFTIVTRYGLHFTISWLEQFSRLLFVWISFIGFSYAATKQQHIKMTAVAELFKGKAAGKTLMLIGDLVCIVVSLYLAYKIAGLTYLVYTKHQYFSAMPFMPIWVMYISGVIGMLGLGIRTIQYGVIPDLRSFKAAENN